ncbi:MAG: hypothetical protein PHY88_02085 [Candidatus Omnitrophica bacterium]|nr:hypothetical protein [Candidatus Omnitrophota bacterium]
MMNLEILEQVFLGNRILDYLIALLILLMSLLFVKLAICAVIKHLKKFAEKTATTFDDFLAVVLEKVVLPGLYLSCIYLGLKTLKVPSAASGALNALQLAIITFFATRIVIMFLGYGLDVYLSKKQEDATLAHSLKGMFRVIKFIIWALAAVILLDNIGFRFLQ